MILSNEQVQALIKKPINENKIKEGRSYESRLRLYTESKNLQELNHESAWKEFNKHLTTTLSPKKYDKIKDFIILPLPVIDVTESCLNDLYKVFEGRNRFFSYEIRNVIQRKQIDELVKPLNIQKWIEDKGKEVIKNKPNSIVVIDKDLNGNPYPLLVCSDRLHDYKISYSKKSVKGQLDYVCFIHSKSEQNGATITRYSFYDSYSYRVISSLNNETFTVELEEPHGLDYCPAIMFMEEALSSQNDYNRKVPFSNSVTKLQEWSIFNIFQYYADHYSAFPIIEAPEEACGVHNCESGIINEEEEYISDGALKTRIVSRECERCKNKTLIGPGTVIRVKNKLDKDDPTEAGVFKIMDSPNENLKYIQAKLDRIEKSFVLKTVGIDDVNQKQAINEMQVESSYENRINVLMRLKNNFDRLYIWIVETASRLVNPELEIKVYGNFGTEFYLLSEQELFERIETAKKIGMPEVEIDMLFRQYIETKYKGNPSKIEKSIIVKYIDPMPYLNLEEVIKIHEKGLISNDDYMFKLNLIKFIDRFELENGSITEFGEKMKPFEKIKKIKEILNSYRDEQKQNSEGE